MSVGKFTLVMGLLTAPVWAQFSKADMLKLATDRSETLAKTLNLSPSQVTAIKPLLETKCIYIGQIKDVYRANAKSDPSSAKKDAQASLKEINAKYNAQISAILTPEQAKKWKRIQQKDWKDDTILPKS
jgi:hypothetical protein